MCVCVTQSVRVRPRAFVCAGAGICADPTFPWRQHNAVRGSRLQGTAGGTSTGTEGERERERDVTKLHCSHYNQHRCVVELETI